MCGMVSSWVNTTWRASRSSCRAPAGPLLVLVFAGGLLLLLAARSSAADEPVTTTAGPEHAAQMKEGRDLFKRDVRRILVGRCVQCHGRESVEAELNLTTREGLLRGGASGAVLTIGQGADSRLVKLIRHLEEPAMPENGAQLDDRQIEAISRWIDLGAPYDQPLIELPSDNPLAWTERKLNTTDRDFWSLQPLTSVPPPSLATGDSPELTAVDRFIRAALEQQKIAPNPVADKRTRVRRAYLDLVGIPPTPEQLAAFESDPRADAWPRLIDQLLESPQYGERWARHWLDVARFAESHGFEQDYDRPHAYHYRDFVIRALNQDLPYDEFVRWQVAGDELAPENPLAMMATGFLGAGVFPTQLTEREFEPARYDELDDMVSTVGTAFLGLTVGCARCHDHKYDPIPSADYYRMVATFATTIRSNLDLDLDPAATRAKLAEFEREHEPLVAAWRDYEQSELVGRFDRWLYDTSAETAASPDLNSPWLALNLASARSQNGATLEPLGDGSWLASGSRPAQDQYHTVADVQLPQLTAVRLEALTHSTLPQGGPGRADNGNFALTKLTVTARPLGDPAAAPRTILLKAARATHQQNDNSLSVSSAIDADPASGWAVDGGGIGRDQAAVFEFAEPLNATAGLQLEINLAFDNNAQHSLGRFRLAMATELATLPIAGAAVEPDVRTGLAKRNAGQAAQLTAAERAALRQWFFAQDPRWQSLQQQVNAHAAQRPQPQLTTVMVASENVRPIPHHADGRGFPHFYAETYFLRRGDAAQKQGPASSGYLQALIGPGVDANPWWQDPPAGAATSHRRAALARWLTDPAAGAGQLLARVMVNRLWQHHFGHGLVRTPNDFGFQGERPTHPELLDWLAHQLIAHRWQLKPIHKLLMTSQVYQQSSQENGAATLADPDNRLWWRFAPRRLEAEIVRDAMLSVGGLLDPTMYGPGSLDEGMRRRSIYFTVKRSQLVPMMQVFDSPEPLVSVGERPTTTIAPQALTLMNGPQIRAAAHGVVLQAVRRADAPAGDASSTDAAAAVRQIYQVLLLRSPTDNELASSLRFVQSQTASYDADGRQSARETALTDLAQVLLSLNEFVYVE